MKKEQKLIANQYGLAFKTLKLENSMIEAEIEPKGSLKESWKNFKSFFPFIEEEDRKIYAKDCYEIFIPDDEDIQGWKETLEAIKRYFQAEVPKYARKRKKRWEKIPERPELKKYRVMENGNFPTTNAGASLYGLDGKLIQTKLEVVTDDPRYDGKFTGLVNLTKNPIKIKNGYHSTGLGYACDDLVVEPGQVIVQVRRGNGYCFSTYLVGDLEPAPAPVH